jgi:hypothetical protein
MGLSGERQQMMKSLFFMSYTWEVLFPLEK